MINSNRYGGNGIDGAGQPDAERRREVWACNVDHRLLGPFFMAQFALAMRAR